MPQVVDVIPLGKYRQVMEDQHQGTAPSRDPVPWIHVAPDVIWTLLLLQPVPDLLPIDGGLIDSPRDNRYPFKGGESIDD